MAVFAGISGFVHILGCGPSQLLKLHYRYYSWAINQLISGTQLPKGLTNHAKGWSIKQRSNIGDSTLLMLVNHFLE